MKRNYKETHLKKNYSRAFCIHSNQLILFPYSLPLQINKQRQSYSQGLFRIKFLPCFSSKNFLSKSGNQWRACIYRFRTLKRKCGWLWISFPEMLLIFSISSKPNKLLQISGSSSRFVLKKKFPSKSFMFNLRIPHNLCMLRWRFQGFLFLYFLSFRNVILNARKDSLKFEIVAAL